MKALQMAGGEAIGAATDAAKALLERKGWKVLAKGIGDPPGLIALDDEGEIVFAAVGATVGEGAGLPEERVTARARAALERAAGEWLAGYDGPGARVRFDTVGVWLLPGNRALARHTVNAFGRGD